MSLSMEAKVKIISFQSTKRVNKTTGSTYQIGSGFCKALNSPVIIKRTVTRIDETTGELIEKPELTEAHIGQEYTAYITTDEAQTTLFAEISLKSVIGATAIAAFLANAKETATVGA